MVMLSALSMYRYDPSIFEGFKSNLPPEMSQENIVNSLLFETCELEILYPDPDVFKTALSIWSTARRPAWLRVYSALTAEYSPIENTDRYEDITDTTTVTTGEDTTDTRKGDTTVTASDSTKFKEGDRTSTESESDTESVAGYNSESFVNNRKNDRSNNRTDTHAEDSTTGSSSSTSNATSENKINKSGTETREFKHVNHTHGNIGVTSNQKMVNEELELRLTDVTKFIVDDFKNHFCILVY